MAFIVDNLLYSFSAYIWMGKKIKFEEPEDVTVRAEDVTVLIPTKNEEYEAMELTIRGIIRQSIVPKIWLLLDERDIKTIKQENVLRRDFQDMLKSKCMKTIAKLTL